MKKIKDMNTDELVALANKKMDDTGMCGGDECIDMYINGIKDALRDQDNNTNPSDGTVISVNIPAECIDFQELSFPIECNNELYDFEEDDLVETIGQNEYWEMIIQRQSDGKYFKNDWCNDEGNWDYGQEYEPKWTEVKPVTTTITVFK